MMKIAIDLGNRYVKAVSETGQSIMFRSVIAQGNHRSMYSLSKKQSSVQDSIQVEFRGQQYYVGRMAERFGALQEYVFGRERFDTESVEILIWTALSFLAKDNEPVDLVLDYPYSQFEYVKDKLTDRLTGKTENIRRFQDSSKQLVIRSVNEYPQSLVAVYALNKEMPEVFRTDLDGLIALVDIGGDTTDVVVLETFGGELVVHEEISGTIPHGTRDITQVIRRSLEAQTGDMMDTDLADRVLDHGSIYFGAKEWNFTKEVAESKKNLASSLKAQTASLWGTKKNRIRTVVFLGGGATLMAEELQDFHVHQVIADNPQWKNARGCLLTELRELAVEKQQPEPVVEQIQSTIVPPQPTVIEESGKAEPPKPNESTYESTQTQNGDHGVLDNKRETHRERERSHVPNRFREGAAAWS